MRTRIASGFAAAAIANAIPGTVSKPDWVK